MTFVYFLSWIWLSLAVAAWARAWGHNAFWGLFGASLVFSPLVISGIVLIVGPAKLPKRARDDRHWSETEGEDRETLSEAEKTRRGLGAG